MAKIYPFKYRFENKGIMPLHDSVWFESHQELLLRIVNTPQGRDLLCIDKDFDGMPIVGFAKNRVTGLLGFEGDNVKLVSDFRVGAKWANVIRYRWREFQALAREHYSDKVNKQTEIVLDGRHRMAATTSTFFPNADGDPDPATTDGFARRNGRDETFSTLRSGAGGPIAASPAGNALFLSRIETSATSNQYEDAAKNFVLLDTESIDTDNIDSSMFKFYAVSLLDELSGASSDNSKTVLTSSTPASNITLVSADYSQVSFSDDYGRSAKAADIVLSAYNDIILNGDGLAAINKTGITKFGLVDAWLFDNTTAGLTWSATNRHELRASSADEVGTSQSPKLVVMHSSAISPNTVWF